MKPDKFLEVALSQVGYKETGKDITKYGEWYGMNGQPWCAMFVSWCANQVGVLNTLIPKYASSSAGYKWFQKNTGVTMSPKPGYIGFIKNTGSNKKTYPAEHTFIVYDVQGNYVITIEGNLDNAVKKYKRKIDDKILGFGVVNWEYDKYTYKYVDNVDYEGLNVRYINNGKKTGQLLQEGSRVPVYDIKGNKAIISETTYVNKNYLVDKVPNYKKVSGADSEGLNVRPRYVGGIMGKPIACLPNGTQVKVYDVKGSYSKVSPDSNAWCYSRYLK